MFKKYLHFIVVLFIFITSCKTAKHTSNAETKSSKESNKTKHILDGNWVFVTMPGKDVKLTELFPNKMPEAMIDVSQGKISGYAGCNRFSARMTVDKDNIKIIQPIPKVRNSFTRIIGTYLWYNRCVKHIVMSCIKLVY